MSINQTTCILGIPIPSGLLGVKYGRKYLEGETWILATRNGVILARFTSEPDLEQWWQFFQESQGRPPVALTADKGEEFRQKHMKRSPKKKKLWNPPRPKTKPSPDDVNKYGNWW